jgi:choline dehydrogenase-like flavoprotein
VGFSDLLPCVRRSEGAAGRDPALRGIGGPAWVAPVPENDRHPVAVAFADALQEVGCPVTDDLSGANQEGVAWVNLAVTGGERVRIQPPFREVMQLLATLWGSNTRPQTLTWPSMRLARIH